ncbi:unnamed protein product [Urochloa decumbens]|uniref:Secreted protein n=1 Tax=Urochloa decumbens TaxID=240449 RepID=A0ABC8VGJ7_9POAL
MKTKQKLLLVLMILLLIAASSTQAAFPGHGPADSFSEDIQCNRLIPPAYDNKAEAEAADEEGECSDSSCTCVCCN